MLTLHCILWHIAQLRMSFLLSLVILITEYSPKIVETFQAWILSFFLVVITIIHPMILWTNYYPGACKHAETICLMFSKPLSILQSYKIPEK
uniref:Uncharacterized protein n=1 Tax=Rhizophora mucronata TaxID=61149 RepID=A0A2P2KL99_RHIMU